jgi:4-hydroxy-tetrahydrodipicolinate reductase
MVQFAAQRAAFSLVAAVDTDPGKVGKDVGELCGLPRLGVTVTRSLEDALQGKKADVAILTTVSDLATIAEQLAGIMAHGLSVVSTCEELSFPWDISPEIAQRIDAAARRAGVAALGTGVNPGFLMDSFPLALTAACQSVESIQVTRIQDASARRVPFQKKIGAGLTLREFEALRKKGTLRHVGLSESIGMIASRMGWKLDSISEELTPIVAGERIVAGETVVEQGHAAGVQQIGKGFSGRMARITLLFRAAIGEPGPHDTVEINGTPSIRSTIVGGVNGDIATCAITLNAVPRLLAAGRGLKTMADIPLVSFFG